MSRVYLLSFLFFLASCATFSDDEKKIPPITKQSTIVQAVKIALDHGGNSTKKLKKVFADAKQKASVSEYLEARIEKQEDIPTAKFVRLVQLYGYFNKEPSVKIFRQLVSDKSILVRQLGWQLAMIYPSPEIQQVIENIITFAILKGQEDHILLPQMAQAVAANKLNSVYTFLRYGLMNNGDDEFARAMIALDPDQAQEDFMDYLGKATIEDLRQINQKTVDIHTSLVILNFYLSNDLPLFHPKITSVILFSISRNRGLAELASLVLDRELERHGFEIALMMSRLPQWIQIAFIENQRRVPTPNGSSLLSHLRDVSAFPVVVDEINSILR